MKLLIDTCNVLHRTGVLPPEMAGIDEESLANLIRSSRYRNHKSLLVCDGNARSLSGGLRGRSRGLIQFKFSGQAQSADTLILDLVARSNSPKRVIVVSSDREIQVMARRRRCQIIDSDRFLTQLTTDNQSQRFAARDPKSAGPLGDGEIEEWLARFEVDEATAALPRDGNLEHTEKMARPKKHEEEKSQIEPPPSGPPELIEDEPSDWPSRISQAEALIDSEDDDEPGR